MLFRSPTSAGTVPDRSGFVNKVRSCWQSTVIEDRPASNVAVALKMAERGNQVQVVSVTGTAAQYGPFKACVMNHADFHARQNFGEREAGKTVTLSTSLPACKWDKAAMKHRCE